MKTTVIEPYGFRLVLIETTRDVATARKKWIDPEWEVVTPDEDDSVGGYVALAGGRGDLERAPVILVRIRLHEGHTEEHLFNTVVHEATHVTNAIFDTIGQSIDYGHDEPHAYLLAHVAEWIWGQVGPHAKTRSKK